MKTILNTLKQNDNSQPFLFPVDRLMFKDYFDLIKFPMDILTVENKLSNHEYQNECEVLKDLNQIW